MVSIYTRLADIADPNNSVEDLTESGKCSNCGSCCTRFIPVSDSERRKISKYVKKHNIVDMRSHSLATIDMRCPFRDEINQKCIIYPVRPSICRTFICNMSERDVMLNKKLHMHRYSICDLTTLLQGDDIV